MTRRVGIAGAGMIAAVHRAAIAALDGHEARKAVAIMLAMYASAREVIPVRPG